MDFSLISSIFETLRLTPPAKLTLLDGHLFIHLHYPPTPPDVDTLILNIDSQELALQIKKVLLAVYPDSHNVFIVIEGKKKEERLGDFQPTTFNLQPSTCFFIPSLGQGTSFESFAEIVSHNISSKKPKSLIYKAKKEGVKILALIEEIYS